MMNFLNLVFSFFTTLVGMNKQDNALMRQERQHDEDNAFNAEQAELQRQWQSSENEIARQFNADQSEQYLNTMIGESQKNRDFQHQEAEIARQWEEDFYNQYQSPEAMMRQYKAAGLNPALMAGGYNPPSVSAGSSPSGSMPSGSPASSPGAPSGASASASGFMPILNIMDSYVRMAQVFSQVQNINADTEKKKAETGLQLQQARATELANQLMERTQEFSVQQAEANVEKTRNEISKLAMDINEAGFLVTTQDLRRGILEAEKVLKQTEASKMSAEAFMKQLEKSFYESKGWSTPPSILVPLVSSAILGGSQMLNTAIGKLFDLKGLKLKPKTPLKTGQTTRGPKGTTTTTYHYD